MRPVPRTRGGDPTPAIVGALVKAVPDILKGLVDGLLSKENIKRLKDGFVNLLTSAFNEAVDAVKDVFGSIGEWLGIGGSSKSSGKSYPEGTFFSDLIDSLPNDIEGVPRPSHGSNRSGFTPDSIGAESNQYTINVRAETDDLGRTIASEIKGMLDAGILSRGGQSRNASAY